MAVTIEKFRKQFKAFSEKIEYSDSEIQPSLDLAILEMGTDPERWGGEEKYDMLVLYLAAHHLENYGQDRLVETRVDLVLSLIRELVM